MAITFTKQNIKKVIDILDDPKIRELYKKKDLVNYIYDELGGKKKIVVKNKIAKDGTEITHKLICDTIYLFEKYLPQDFTGSKNIYGRKVVKDAVEKILETHTFDEVNNIIQQYFVNRKSEEFRPSAGTVLEFCTTKFAKIQDFLQKPNRRYSLNNVPGENLGDFAKTHNESLAKILEEKKKLTKEFFDSINNKN